MTNTQSGIVGIADGEAQRAGMMWAASIRKLGAATLERLGVAFGTAYFPDLGRKSNAMFFRYTTGWKARSFPTKSHVSGPGFKLAFWNLQNVLAGQLDVVYLTEGELDACALVEAGIPVDCVLSVPNGAKIKPAEDPRAMRGYAYVDDALRAGLNRAKRFVWCGDTDDAGYALRADMVRLLGPARFTYVTWPDGVRDANDFLRTDGADNLRELVSDGALPWPVQGVYKMPEIPTPPPLVTWRPGFDQWENKVLLAPRTLSVATGHPGHGKTQLWQQIWFQIARAYDVTVCVASFETRPKPHLRRQYRTLFNGKLERDQSEEERKKADDWIEGHYLFLIHEEQRPTLEWFLEMAEVAVVRESARVVLLDPWNRLEAARDRDEKETEYIGRCLRELHGFAHDMNCHVQIIAHPAKMDGKRRGQAPGLEDISGSKNWENMPDQGFVIHRPELFDGATRKTECVFYHRKARFDELGHPCQLKMDYVIAKGRYVSTDYPPGY